LQSSRYVLGLEDWTMKMWPCRNLLVAQNLASSCVFFAWNSSSVISPLSLREPSLSIAAVICF